jgi:hypothetical protein
MWLLVDLKKNDDEIYQLIRKEIVTEDNYKIIDRIK